ncbi:MAG: tryptophan synthase subunit alpha [Xanthomonadales bacterium]|nr:tryptophan synthase subunit alpha [Xanthomonadales bacterium]
MSRPELTITSPGQRRIEARFAALKAARRTGLVPFITAGDPLPQAQVALMHALVAAGADLIELGVPFSDPMADGPVIQHASERAIARGTGLDEVFGWVREFRRKDATTPVVLMGYMNPVAIRGTARFAADAADAGVDGVLLVDCPIEETAAAAPLGEAGLARILLAAPTTPPERLARIVRAAEGFLYHVAFAGITGADRVRIDDVREHVEAIRRHGDIPVAVGFGVRDAASAARIGAFADAVVIGSALVERLVGATDEMDLCQRARDFLAPVRAALESAEGVGRSGSGS